MAAERNYCNSLKIVEIHPVELIGKFERFKNKLF